MNILTPYSWLTEFLKRPDSAADLAKKISACGDNVEYAHHLAENFDKMVVGKILEIKAHPNADKLKVVITDVGSKKEIVCGGSNLVEGHLVAVALPGAKVRWHGEGELVELKETGIRGVNSFGMICAPAEIGFEKLQGEEHEIWDITDLTDAKPGTPLSKALELDDVVFDIEVTTNRPDAMSMVGLAREAGAVGAGTFDWQLPVLPKGEGKKLSVRVETKDLCPRYQAVVLENVTVKPSPWWLQKRLLLSGHRPINNVVDVTNYILHELGQPLHAFDADKLEKEMIVVRKAKKGETLLALDGREYELDPSMLVIADATRPVAIAGVMGGEPTGTTKETTRLVIECATFDPVSVRKTSRALNLYSDSSSLFEKGLAPESTEVALARAIELLQEIAGAKVASVIIDERAKSAKPDKYHFDPEAINARIGIKIPVDKQKDILEKLGFVINGDEATPPYWRARDIEDDVDLVEEVIRVYGYDKVPAVLPEGKIPVLPIDPLLRFERQAKQFLSQAGCTELYEYSFTSAQDLRLMDFPIENAVKIQNPLSEEWTYMRPSVLVSALKSLEENQHRFESADLFEYAAIHELGGKDGLPRETHELVIISYSNSADDAFLRVKGYFERLARATGLSWQMDRDPEIPLMHPGQSAILKSGETHLGEIGILAPNLIERFKLDVAVAVVVLHVEDLVSCLHPQKKYTPIPEFQDAKRDLSFILDNRVEYISVVDLLQDSHPLVQTVEFLDIYQGKGIDAGKKSMTFRLSLRAEDHTLTSEEADQVIKEVMEKLRQEFEIVVR